MSFNDPIAELLTKIRNAKNARLRFVDISCSKMKKSILGLLKQHGFVENFLIDEGRRKMRVFLRYTKTRDSVLNGLERRSRPSCRHYVGYREIPRVCNGLGIVILSTPGGVMEGEVARKAKLGGELLCQVW
jgi:small subunit ribosomal protein S8